MKGLSEYDTEDDSCKSGVLDRAVRVADMAVVVPSIVVRELVRHEKCNPSAMMTCNLSIGFLQRSISPLCTSNMDWVQFVHLFSHLYGAFVSVGEQQ